MTARLTVYIVFIAVAFAMTGCASTKVTKLKEKEYPSKNSSCKIRVIDDFPRSPAYEELAVIEGKAGQTAFHGQRLDDLLPDMMKKACELGADALVLKSTTESSYHEMYSGKLGEASGVAIKFVE